jgi:hypothetical protein
VNRLILSISPEIVKGAGARERPGHCPHEGEHAWNEAGINLMGLVGRVTDQFISLKCLLHIPPLPD